MPEPVDELKLLIRSRHPMVTIETVEENKAVRVIGQACDELRMPMFVWTIVEGLRRVLPEKGASQAGTDQPTQALAHIGLIEDRAVFVFKDLGGHLKDAKNVRLLRDLAAHYAQDERMVVMIDHSTSLPSALSRLAVPFDLPLPDAEEIEAIIRETFRTLAKAHSVRAKVTQSDMDAMVQAMRSLTEQEIRRAVTRAIMEDESLDASDLAGLLAFKRDTFLKSGILEYVDVDREQTKIGGLTKLKEWLAKRRHALGREAVEYGVDPPRGVLLVGVQGCGKSLAAKTVAAEWSMPLLRLDPGKLYDKYIGETERRLREAFRVAESMAPAVLWIDEIEKGFASASSRSSDGGLSKRIFGSLLSWLQDREAPVFCVATANDITALPPELVRKGRFDEIFFVDLPDSPARERIFAIHLERRRANVERFDLGQLAGACEGFSGAEIEQAVVSGLYAAFGERRELTQADVLAELEATRPLSVTMAEKVAALRAWAATRCVPAD